MVSTKLTVSERFGRDGQNARRVTHVTIAACRNPRSPGKGEGRIPVGPAPEFFELCRRWSLWLA